jgi:hypothetical protein
MALLPPTIGERIAKCGTQIEVWGIVPGANVDLRVNGASVLTQNVAGSYAVFAVAALNANDQVTALQTFGAETSGESPAVVVGDVQLPPPPPHVAPSVYGCLQCFYADGMAPGSTFTLLRADVDGSAPLGTATAGRDGAVCFGPSSSLQPGPVFAQVATCAQLSTFSPQVTVELSPASLPAPGIRSPIFSCQNVITMDGLTQGASVLVLTDHNPLGSFCSCWGAVNVNLPRALVAPELVTAKQTMIDLPNHCNTDGAETAPGVTVVPPDERIKPALRPVLYDGDRIVRVQNQISGGEISILEDAGAGASSLGRAGASQFEEIALNGTLVAGRVMRASQTLCGRTEVSDPLTVQPRPAAIGTPVVRAPLYSCGVLVVVDSVLAGAQVRVFQNGFPVGFAWADGPSVTVRIGPGLVAGGVITAVQRVSATDSPTSLPVMVGTLGALPAPSILPPLRIGDRSVRVGGLVPGAFVRVTDRGMLVGTADAVESTVSVNVSQPLSAGSQIIATQSLCAQTSPPSQPGPTPLIDPSSPGDLTPSNPADTPGTGFDVPPSADGPGIHVTITGELTFPTDPGNPNAVDPRGAPYPLVIIAHGNHNRHSPSYQGYRYLANHLASQGMICLSANLNDLNQMDDLIDARGLVILEHIRVLLQRNTTPGDLLQNKIDPNNIGLVGHSRGAEGVVDAQVQNMSRPLANRFSIKQVVPIAPTNFLSRRNTGAPLFIIYGSADADVSGSWTGVNPFFIYDHSETPKAMIFIHHARHNGFNEVWVRPAEENEVILAGTLSPAEHQAIAKAYISAAFQSALLNRPAYDIYLQGPVRPLGLEGFSIHNQYQVTNRLVVDNFGDADPQLGIPLKNPIQRESNTLNRANAFTQLGADAWSDQEMRSLPQNPHDSRATQLKWAGAENLVSGVDSRDVRGFSMLSIRLGQQYRLGATLNAADQPQDLMVTLLTAGGDAAVRVGSVTDLPYPHVRPDNLTKAALKTVRVPLASFTAINPGLTLDQVTGVRLNFGLTTFGAICADDIDFSV